MESQINSLNDAVIIIYPGRGPSSTEQEARGGGGGRASSIFRKESLNTGVQEFR